jgi:hypothetical protein
MKTKFKVIALALIAALTLFALCIPAFAYEDEEVAGLDADVEVGDKNEGDENVFTAAFNRIKEYATEIFCAMTFIGSLILAFAYKKGLLPLVEKALVSIGSSVTKIKERTESGAMAAEELGASVTKQLESCEKLINALAGEIGKMNSELAEIRCSERKRTENTEELSVIVGTQIDMLYDIFMTSALPQYQKDAVGERVAKMKEALAGNGNTK